jgi:bifunctional non-homologous end joining protein LigD
LPSGSRSGSRSNSARTSGAGLYLDTARNAYDQTAVAPYAVRALPDAPVACPLDWNELGRVEPQQFIVRNIFRRLARKHDPWADIGRDAGSLCSARARLDQLRRARAD